MPNVRTVQLDGTQIRSKAAFLEAVAAALNFPDYFGHNWDALDECLADIEEDTEVVWTDSGFYAAADPEGFRVAVDCFKQAPRVRLLPR